MAVEDTFVGARTGLSLLFAYMGVVAQELGMEKAIAFDNRMCMAMGAAQGKMIKAQAGIETVDVQTAAKVLLGAIEQGFGIPSETIEESPDRVVLKIGKCAVCEAAAAVGMEPQTIEATCRAGAISFVNAMAKELNPDLKYELREFRPSADGCCEELIVSALRIHSFS